MLGVPYKGSAPAISDTIGGQTQFMFPSLFTALPHVKAGKLRAMAVAGPKRSALLPDVPTLKEAGYGAEYAQWSGLFIPAATPEPVAQRLRAAARMAAHDARVKEVILGAGSPILYQDTPEFETYVQGDVRRMADVVKKIGKVE